MKQGNFPLITIGVTCFNSEATIPDAIQSALAQDYPNLEVLVVDDGSSDNSVRLIKDAIAGAGHARLIVHEQNKGFAGALNTIINEAQGAFLAIFDDDDKSLPHRVSAQYKRITEYEAASGAREVICHAARTQTFPNGYERYEPTMGTKEEAVPRGKDVADRILIGRLSKGVVGSCANCSRMGRIEVFRKMNGYDASMRRAEDTDFNIRFALSGGHFVGIEEPLVIQTMTTGDEKTLAAEQVAETLLLNKHRPYLESIGWYEFCKAWLDARYDYLGDKKMQMLGIVLGLALTQPLKLARKILWMIPATATRRDFKKWHHGGMGA